MCSFSYDIETRFAWRTQFPVLGKWGKWGKKNKEDEEFVAEVEREAAFYGPSQNQYAPSYPMHVTHQPQEPEPGFSLQQSTTEYTPADASYTPKKPSPQ